MTFQEGIVADNDHAVEMLYRSVKRMPFDKIPWSPLGHGRTTLDQLQECANAPDLYLTYLEPGYQPSSTSIEEALALQKSWDVDQCEAHTRAMTSRLNKAILALDDLTVSRSMPWGQEMTMKQIASLHLWNLTYHLGQINYIQTLYGDAAMM